MNAVLLRFPHGTEYHWTRDVPEVGQVVTRGTSAWIVVSRVAGELPSVVLRRHLGEPAKAAPNAVAA